MAGDWRDRWEEAISMLLNTRPVNWQGMEDFHTNFGTIFSIDEFEFMFQTFEAAVNQRSQGTAENDPTFAYNDFSWLAGDILGALRQLREKKFRLHGSDRYCIPGGCDIHARGCYAC